MRQVAQHLAEVAGEEVGDPGRCLVVGALAALAAAAAAASPVLSVKAGWL